MTTTEVVGEEFTTDVLSHFGKKGMKWGVRNKASQVKASRSKRNESKPSSKAKKLSDDDLKTAVARLRLEKDFVQLSSAEKSSKPVKGLLTKHGSKAVNTVAGTVTTAVVGLALNKAMNRNPKGPKIKLKDNMSFS